MEEEGWRFSRGTLTICGRGDDDSRVFGGLVRVLNLFSLRSRSSVCSGDSTCSIRRFFGLKAAAGLMVGSMGIGDAGFWYSRNIAGGIATLGDAGLGVISRPEPTFDSSVLENRVMALASFLN